MSEPSEPSGPGGDTPAIRVLADATTMRGLTHPVRIALIEALGLEGKLTATQAAEVIDESPTTCSFHLRQLAKYGFVEEAGGGKGRTRPWRLTSVGMSITSTGVDPATRVAAGALVRLFHDRWFARQQEWMDTRAGYPVEWQQAAGSSESVTYLTAAELDELSEDLRRCIDRFAERRTDPARRPAGSLPVEMVVLTHPLRAPEGAPQ